MLPSNSTALPTSKQMTVTDLLSSVTGLHFQDQLKDDTDGYRIAGISTVVQIIPVVVAHVNIVGRIPVRGPTFGPRVNQHEPKPVVQEPWITTNYSGLAGDAEPMLVPEIETESGVRNVVATVTAALVPRAMLALPLRGAFLLPGIVPLPSAALL